MPAPRTPRRTPTIHCVSVEPTRRVALQPWHALRPAPHGILPFSSCSHYRMRAEFSVDQRDGGFHFVMFENVNGTVRTEDNGGSGGKEQEEGQEKAAAPAAAAPAAAAVGGVGAAEAPEGSAGQSPEQPQRKKQKKGEHKGQGAAAGRPKGPQRVRVETFPVASKQVGSGAPGWRDGRVVGRVVGRF